MSEKIKQTLEENESAVVQVTAKDLKDFGDYLIQNQTKKSESERLYPIKYWVDRLGKTRQTLRLWEKAGKVKPTRIGRMLYYKESDFESQKK